MTTTATTGTSYYTTDNTEPKRILRRANYVDEVYTDGKWQRTNAIIDYMAGHNDNIDAITEAQARKIAPDAF